MVGSFALMANTISAQDYMNMLSSKSYSQFANHLDQNVQLEIMKDKLILPKDQAINRISKRLNSLNPVRWELVHRGESEEKEGSYLVLKAYNDQDEGVRIFLHMIELDGKKKISSIRFRKLL